MRIGISVLALFLTLTLQGATVTGKVTCDGAPVAGVSVSDGTNVARTCANGTYKLKSSLDLGYVFISVPSGYEVPADGIVPQFFRRLDPKAKAATADFALKKVDQSRADIIVFNDIHLTNDPVYHDIDQVTAGFFTDVKAHVKNLAGPLYAMTLGDMTTDSRWYKRNYFLHDWMDQIADFPAPVFHAMGNHDNDIKGGSDLAACKPFRDNVGPYYYSLNIGAFHFVILDNIVYDMPLGPEGKVEKSNGYKTYVDARQISWLKKDLKSVSKDTPVVILQHAPFYRIEEVIDGRYYFKDGFSAGHSCEEVISLLRKYKTYVLSGHTHMNYFVEMGESYIEHNCVAVAGSSWYTEKACGLNLSSDGLMGGYAVYTIEGKNLSWYYKAPGYDVEHCQFRCYDINTVPAEYAEKLPANSVLLNVFNYDPKWKVDVFEDGKALEVKQVWVRDPLYTDCAVNQDFFNAKKGAFMSHRNSHMFTARASSATSTLEIVVTDRFGRQYRHTMTRPAAYGFDMQLGN